MSRLLPTLLVLSACSGAVRQTDSDTDVPDTDVPERVVLFINEILASNDAAQSWFDTDGGEHFDDWVEIYNPGTEAVDLAGFGLGDGGAPWRFPAGTAVGAGGHLLVWCSDGELGPFLHADFAISRSGEQLTLVDADDQVLDQVDMPEQTTDVATYRSPDGGETWAFGEGTPGAANP